MARESGRTAGFASGLALCWCGSKPAPPGFCFGVMLWVLGVGWFSVSRISIFGLRVSDFGFQDPGVWLCDTTGPIKPAEELRIGAYTALLSHIMY